MPAKKIKRSLTGLLIAYATFYLLITLLPACIYGIAAAHQKSIESPENSSVQTPPPGFLDDALPGSTPNESTDKANTFTLHDEATGKTLHLTAEELIPAAIACEMDLSSPPEALKAQAVACYTLFCKKRADGETIACNSESRQIYTTEDVLRERWGEDFESNMALLRSIAEETAGQLLTWKDEPILAAYFAISCGSTESAANVWQSDLPYLQTVASAGDAFSDGYLSTVSMSPEEFADAAAKIKNPPSFSGSEENWLTSIEYSSAGYVKSAVLGGNRVTGQELRSAFSLRSACFQVEYIDGEFIFTVHGWGHGVGMSQAGAAFMAKRGASYTEILSHYYPGTVLKSDNNRQVG